MRYREWGLPRKCLHNREIFFGISGATRGPYQQKIRSGNNGRSAPKTHKYHYPTFKNSSITQLKNPPDQVP
jgi:hypothetical protein